MDETQLDKFPPSLQKIIDDIYETPIGWWKNKSDQELKDLLAACKLYKDSKNKKTASCARGVISSLECKFRLDKQQQERKLELELKRESKLRKMNQKIAHFQKEIKGNGSTSWWLFSYCRQLINKQHEKQQIETNYHQTKTEQGDCLQLSSLKTLAVHDASNGVKNRNNFKKQSTLRQIKKKKD